METYNVDLELFSKCDCLLGRIGFEHQRWYNYTSHFLNGNENFWNGPADAGFTGLAVMLTLTR